MNINAAISAPGHLSLAAARGNGKREGKGGRERERERERESILIVDERLPDNRNATV